MSSSVLATPVATTTPLNGALGYDIAQPNALFVGNGTSFVNVSDGDPNNVKGPASAVSGDIATYNGTTGKLIQDSGITISSSTTASISFTSAGSNPTITGWLKLQKIATSVNSMVYFEVGIFAAPTVTTPDTWTATAVIPSGYRPANTGQIVPPVYNSTFPGTIDTDAQLNVSTAGNIVFNIRDTLTGATIVLSTFYGNYSV